MKLTFDAKFMFVSGKGFFLFSNKSLQKDSSNHFLRLLNANHRNVDAVVTHTFLMPFLFLLSTAYWAKPT